MGASVLTSSWPICHLLQFLWASKQHKQGTGTNGDLGIGRHFIGRGFCFICDWLILAFAWQPGKFHRNCYPVSWYRKRQSQGVTCSSGLEESKLEISSSDTQAHVFLLTKVGPPVLRAKSIALWCFYFWLFLSLRSREEINFLVIQWMYSREQTLKSGDADT